MSRLQQRRDRTKIEHVLRACGHQHCHDPEGTESGYDIQLLHKITRHDLRELVRRGLGESQGRYKSLLKLFGMSTRDYRRFMNFLAAHECGVGVREFRSEATATPSRKFAAVAVAADVPKELTAA